MGRKGKRRKRPQRRDRAPAPENVAVEPAEEAPEPVTPEVVDRDRSSSDGDRPRGLFGAGMIPSPYPPLTRSLLPAARAVGSDPVVLVLSFVFVLAAWGLFTALGSPPGPFQMGLLMGVTPVASFGDALFSLVALPDSTYASLGIVIALTLVRSVVQAILLSRIIPALGRSVARDARSLARRTLSVFAVNAAGLGIVLAAFQVIAGFLGQFLGFVLISGIGLYFLAMSIVVVMAEGVSAAEGLRRGFRAARLPGMRHATLVMLYLVFIVFSASLNPGGPLPPATPSLTVWILTLVETFVHLVLLAAFAHRWLSVRDQVPSGPARRRERTGVRG